ncbi:hypothetical protein V3C99_018188 [Haemonchus contortus]|uniref:Uncharacterized protein n=1 Tax=Haemonchus contortus TaxID=6289 RepID=A0A7I4Z259_HAECO
MLIWGCGWTRLDRITNEEVMAAMQTAPGGYANSPSSAEDEGAAPAMVRACAEKTTESSVKGGNGARSSGLATTRSPKKEMAGRDQKDLAEAKIAAEDAAD